MDTADGEDYKTKKTANSNVDVGMFHKRLHARVINISCVLACLGIAQEQGRKDGDAEDRPRGFQCEPVRVFFIFLCVDRSRPMTLYHC